MPLCGPAFGRKDCLWLDHLLWCLSSSLLPVLTYMCSLYIEVCRKRICHPFGPSFPQAPCYCAVTLYAAHYRSVLALTRVCFGLATLCYAVISHDFLLLVTKGKGSCINSLHRRFHCAPCPMPLVHATESGIVFTHEAPNEALALQHHLHNQLLPH